MSMVPEALLVLCAYASYCSDLEKIYDIVSMYCVRLHLSYVPML